jgi:hypothetical protein
MIKEPEAAEIASLNNLIAQGPSVLVKVQSDPNASEYDCSNDGCAVWERSISL